MLMHVLEFFTDGCALCEQHLETIRTAKCGDCELIVYNAKHPNWREKVRGYNVDLLPTLVVDQEVRVEGRQDSRWICQGPYAVALRAKFPAAIPRPQPSIAA